MTVELTKPLTGDEEIDSLLHQIESHAGLPSYEGDDMQVLSRKEARQARKAEAAAYRHEKRRLRQVRTSKLGAVTLGGSYQPDNTTLTRRERRRRDGKSLLPPTHGNTETAFDADARYDRRTLFRLAGVVALATLTGEYTADVRETTERERQSVSYTASVYPSKSPEGKHRLLKVFAGFGNRSSIPTAEAVEAYADDHVVAANVLGQEGIDMNRLAIDSLGYMEREGEDEMSYAGYSMGGLMALREAAIIHETKDGPPIDSITLVCTPADVDVLRPEVRASGYWMARMMSWVPGAEKSQIDRFMVEVFGARWREIIFPSSDDELTPIQTVAGSPNKWFEYGRQVVERLVNTSRYVIHEKLEGDIAASNRVAWGQFAMIGAEERSMDADGKLITASGAESSLKKLGKPKHPGDKPPTIIFVRPLDNNADQTVDNVASTALMQQYALESGLPYIDIQVAGIGHADPIQHPKEHAFAIELARRARRWLGARPSGVSAIYTEEVKTKDGHGIVTIYPLQSGQTQ